MFSYIQYGFIQNGFITILGIFITAQIINFFNTIEVSPRFFWLRYDFFDSYQHNSNIIIEIFIMYFLLLSNYISFKIIYNFLLYVTTFLILD